MLEFCCVHVIKQQFKELTYAVIDNQPCSSYPPQARQREAGSLFYFHIV